MNTFQRVRQLTPLAKDFRYFLALGGQKQRFLEMDRILRAQSASQSVDGMGEEINWEH